jgi:hypothetical protein
MHSVQVSKWFRAALIPAILISSASFALSGCGDTTSEPQNTGGFAPVSELSKDKKAMEQSKAAMLKNMSTNK